MEGVRRSSSGASEFGLWIQHQQTGTLLDMEEVQPIIPVADLVKIGVQVEWTATGCSMNNEQRVFDPRDPITLSEDDWSVQSPPQQGI